MSKKIRTLLEYNNNLSKTSVFFLNETNQTIYNGCIKGQLSSTR